MAGSTTHDAPAQPAAPAENPKVTEPQPSDFADASRPPELDALLDLDLAFVELTDEFTRRTLAGETIDVDQFLSAHPDHAPAFRKILPILQGLAELEPVDDPQARTAGAHRHGPSPGMIFADFHILREIGRRGMAIV
jgi:hypothetical protein